MFVFLIGNSIWLLAQDKRENEYFFQKPVLNLIEPKQCMNNHWMVPYKILKRKWENE